LVKQDLLGIPVLYLSRYINQNKSEYYRLLQSVRVDDAWEDWLLYILKGIEQTSRQTTQLIIDIKSLMQQYKHNLRHQLPNIYSQDLINNLFRHPYTKINFVTEELKVHRNTATKYLDELVRIGLLSKHKISKENFYLNDALFALLQNVGHIGSEDAS
jgi:Fic family protein